MEAVSVGAGRENVWVAAGAVFVGCPVPIGTGVDVDLALQAHRLTTTRVKRTSFCLILYKKYTLLDRLFNK
jgi:hypothetical protein